MSRESNFLKLFFRTVNVIKSKSDSPVSISQALWKLLGVVSNRIKSIHVRLFRFS